MKTLDATKIFPLRLCVATDTTRSALNGVYIDKERGAAVATDGHKMLIWESETIKSVQKSVILNFADIKIPVPSLAKTTKSLTVHFLLCLPDTDDADQTTFLTKFVGSTDDIKGFAQTAALVERATCVPLRVIDGDYPNCMEAYPPSDSDYLQTIELNYKILDTLGDAMSEVDSGMKRVCGIKLNIPKNPLKAVRLMGTSQVGYKGLIMPIRILNEDNSLGYDKTAFNSDTEALKKELQFFKDKCEGLEAAAKRIQQTIIDLGNERNELQAKLAEKAPEPQSFEETTKALSEKIEAHKAYMKASYRQIKHLVVLTGKKWNELKALTKTEASSLIDEIKKSSKDAVSDKVEPENKETVKETAEV